MADLVVAMTGASGAAYGVRLIEALLDAAHTVHLTISPSGAEVLRHEMNRSIDLGHFEPGALLNHRASRSGQLVYHHFMDFHAGIASGSFPTAGMVACPCSMGTVAAIAHGHSQNLIHRAADVHLKERRRLVIVPRETPLSLIQLRNLATCAEAGAVVLPAMPAFYTRPQTIDDQVDFITARICDHLGVAHQLSRRWG